jgi:putative endonuclease
MGELDIVARADRCLVFCEVKTRVAGTIGGPDGPLDAIGPAKRRRLRRLAGEWLRTRSGEAGGAPGIRFDAIGVTLDRGGALLLLDHVEDAF